MITVLRALAESCLNLLFPAASKTSRMAASAPGDFFEKVGMSRDTATHPEISSIMRYRHPLVRQAIHELKYRGNWDICTMLARIMHDHMVEDLSEEYYFSGFVCPLLIPIPMSDKRRNERGYNQTEMLAHELERLDRNRNFTVRTDILIKKIDTGSQTKLGRSERKKNLRGCFGISAGDSTKLPHMLRNRDIILIDDVLTTGSTLEEAMKTLSEAGVRHIRAFTLAH